MERQVRKSVMQSQVVRILSALIMAPLAIGGVWFGPPYFELLIALAAGLMAWEWRKLVSRKDYGFSGGVLTAFVLAVIGVASFGQTEPALWGVGIGFLLLIMIAWKEVFANKLWTSSGLLYIGIPCVALSWVRNDWQGGRDLVLWLFCVVWATDIGAYLVGKAIGGPRLAPVISPNKTWAGLLGGMGCASGIGALLVVGSEALDPWPAAALGGATAIVAQGGDLLESWVKRHFGVKDSGRIIPGHGGVLDRVDGILMVAPVLALLGLFGGFESWR